MNVAVDLGTTIVAVTSGNATTTCAGAQEVRKIKAINKI